MDKRSFRFTFLFILLISFLPYEPGFSQTGSDRPDFRSKVDQVFGGLDREYIPTGILYNRVVPLSGIERYSGTPGSAVVDLKKWKQIYFEILRSSVDRDVFPELPALSDRAAEKTREGVIPIALMNIRYNRIKQDAVGRGLLRISGDRFEDVPGRTESPYDELTLFAASAMKEHTYYESTVFALDGEFIFDNSQEPPSSVVIDFDDGLGFRRVDLGTDVEVRYFSPGLKTITLRTTEPTAIMTSSFLFEVRRIDGLPAESVVPDLLWENQVATRSYLGEYALYDAYTFFGDGHTDIIQPILFVEGFDLDNTYGWEEIYDLLTSEDLAATLRGAGFDLIILNFHEAKDYLQRNSFALVSLIERVIDERVGDRHLIVTGASMGGLISRHALAWMEASGVPHETELFMSFDSPQAGANIPLGLQHWVEFFSEHDASANEFLEKLNAPGAQQMLVYHHTTGTGSNPLRDTFLSELSDLGSYPDDPGLRMVALANGSGAGPDGGQTGNGGSPMFPGTQIIEYEYYSLLVDIIGNCWAVPDEQPLTLIFEGKVDQIWPFPDDELNVYIEGTEPYDNSPGGLRASMQELADTDVEYGDITTDFPNHSFIPTVSALDLANPDSTPVDLFHNLNEDPDLLSKTPFEAVYFPSSPVNEEHVTITPDNVLFILDNIITGQPPVVADIPDQTIEIGGRFAPIRADLYVSDPDHDDSLMTWTWSTTPNLRVTWIATKRGFRVRSRNGWTGSETITFTATDPDGLSDSDDATFTVNPAPAIAANGSFSMVGGSDFIPTSTMLHDNFPNPFNPSTVIRVDLAEPAFVTLAIYDALGREVDLLVRENLPAGRYESLWNAEGFPSGVYFSRFEAGNVMETKKLVLLK